jgi:hypothetical protein
MWDDESKRESNGVCIRCGCPLWDGYNCLGSNFGGDHRHMTAYPQRDASGHLIDSSGISSGIFRKWEDEVGKYIP